MYATTRPQTESSFTTHDGVSLFYRHWPATFDRELMIEGANFTKIWRQRTAAAMRKNARETPAGCRMHYLLLLLLPLAFAATGCGCMTALPR